ncbi:hypothetical protein L1049_027202 [Liquidambar formosana]|uniref:Uncharacterized protein n=1 Tax=Liquidambar formosana TaxID=63359 RepID=A0AAP0N5I2_LIQFO
MDYSLPIAKRTRLREALFYKEFFEKKKRNGGGESVSGGGDGSVSGGGSGGKRKGSAEVEDKAKKSAKLKVDSQSTVVYNDTKEGEEEVEVEVIGMSACDKDGVDSVDFVGLESTGSKGVPKSAPGFEDSGNVGPIDVDHSEDDDEDVEVEMIGEGGEGVFEFVNSNSSSLKTGSGSKVGGDRGGDFVHIDVDEVVSCGQRMRESNVVNSNGGKGSGVLERTQSRPGDLKKSESVSDVKFVDSDELESSSEEDNDDSDDEDYGVDNSCSDVSLEELTNCMEDEKGDDVDDNTVTKRGSVDAGGEETTVGAGSKRKEVNEEDIFIDLAEDEDEDEDTPINVPRLWLGDLEESESVSDVQFVDLVEEGKDVDDNNSTKRGVDEGGKETMLGAGSKRKKVNGEDTLVDSDENTSINVTRSWLGDLKESDSVNDVQFVDSVEEEDVDDNNAKKRGRVDEGGKETTAGVGSNRENVNEEVIFIDLVDDKDEDENTPINVTQEHDCVAQRTRACLASKSKNKSRPLCLDDDDEEEEQQELNSSSGHDNGGGRRADDFNDESYSIRRKARSNNGNDDDGVQTVGGKDEGELGKPTKRKRNDGDGGQKVGGKDEGELGKPTKRKRVRELKDYDVRKILLDSILEKGEVRLEELVSARGEAPNQETKPPVVEKPLPLKFTFGVEESHLPEKSEDEKHLDHLWAEFDFVLRSCEIGSAASSMVDHEDSVALDVEADRATLCRRGDHYPILDEQIGIKCKFCSFVEVEIDHILPSFSRHVWGRYDRKDSGKVDHTIFDELQFQDFGCESQSGCDPCLHAKGTVWDIIPGIENSMYPHQREGFEFIWKNIAGGIYLDELKKSTRFDGGSGCVISHAPGTGKTRLTIFFLQTYMELYPTCRPVIIAPRTMLLTWEEEFRKWNVGIPFHNLNKPEFSGKENVLAVHLLRRAGHQDRSLKSMRMVKLYSWRKDKSILGISYRLFEKLVGGGQVAVGEGKRKREVHHCNEGDEIRKILLELPGLLVLDEGHTPRNDQSLIWKALSKIETEKRIILSGTPFQNNFSELYNTLCLVRPKFADTILSKKYGDFRNKRGRKSSAVRGKWASLTNSIGKDADDKVEELRAMIDPFVHVHKGTILQENLPGLRDSLVFLQPAPFQKRLLEGIQGTRNPFELGYFVSLISVHPSLFPECCLSEKEEFSVDKDKLKKLRLNPDAGVKTKFLIELIRLCETMKEKVLVFSQYLDPLTFIRDLLESQGKKVLYMDGQLDVKQRQSSINVFNDSTSEVMVLLASTKACSEGINLVGASRVVLLDVVWNPSVERQAISRAYRLGQKKVVYIYHLITSGTMEGEKYCRQAQKDRLSELVFSSVDRDRNGQKISSTVSDDKILEEMVQHDKLKLMFEKIIYQPKESNLIETFSLVDL